MIGVTDEQKLQQMIDELRRMREQCEPKSNQNPRYLRYSNAVSAIRWVIDDLVKERAVNQDR
jgi:hypothetical protein